MSKILELRESRAKLVHEARGIVELCEKESRAITPDEQTKFDKLTDEADKLKGQIATEERREQAAAMTADLNVVQRRTSTTPATSTSQTTTANLSDAVRGWLLHGTEHRMTPDMVEAAHNCNINLSARSITIRMERRAQSHTTTEGGYAVPQTMAQEIEVAQKYFGPMIRTSRILPSSDGRDLLYPMIDDTGNAAVIIGENAAGTGNDLVFDQKNIKMFLMSTNPILVPLGLMADSAVPLEPLIGQVIGERFGRGVNRFFTSGNGTTEPSGIMTTITSGVTAAGISYNTLVDMESALDPAYLNGSQWMMHQKSFAVIKKLVDSLGRPLYLPSLSAKAPDTILGYPVNLNNDMDDTDTSGDKPVVFGRLDKYLGRSEMLLQLVRLNERYIDLGQIGFVGFQRWGGILLDAGTHPAICYEHS